MKMANPFLEYCEQVQQVDVKTRLRELVKERIYSPIFLVDKFIDGIDEKTLEDICAQNNIRL